jgi:hypothetical protein
VRVVCVPMISISSLSPMLRVLRQKLKLFFDSLV